MYIIKHSVAKYGGKHVKDHDSFIGSWRGEAKREVRECVCLCFVGRGAVGLALYNIDCNAHI